MRAANAALVAGIVIVIAGLSGASLAAEESGRTAPEDVVATEEVGGGDASTPAPTEPVEPASDEGDQGDADRVPDEVETAPVEPVEEAGEDEKPSRDSDRDRSKGGDKQPLADVSVDMRDIQFKPKNITIKPGDEVTWTNRDTAQHDATARNGDFETDLLSKGETATIPINDLGTINYYCTVHPTMEGKITVRDDSSNGGDSGDDSSGTSDTSTGTGSTGTSSTGFGDSSGFSGGTGSSGGSLPKTGQAELPLLLLGSALIVFGLLARAFHEYWIWR
jgi:plastocyanin